MAYYTNNFAGQSGLAPIAAHMNDQFLAIEAGFDLVKASDDRSIRAPSGEVLTTLPAGLSNKYLSFGVTGDSVGLISAVKGDSGAATDPASFKRFSNIGPGDSWYPMVAMITQDTGLVGGDVILDSALMSIDGGVNAAEPSIYSGSSYYALTMDSGNIVAVEIQQAGTYMLYMIGDQPGSIPLIEMTLNGVSFSPPLVTEKPTTLIATTPRSLSIIATRSLAVNDSLAITIAAGAGASLRENMWFIMKVA